MRSTLDFNTVFKWILSPLVSRKVDAPANLDGAFWVNCNFTETETEQSLLVKTLEELDSLNFTQKKRESKWKQKQNQYKKPTQDPVGAEQVYNKLTQYPLCLVTDLAILKPLPGQRCEVTCSHENVLMYGRYRKLSRECSQSPWCIDGKTTRYGSVESIIFDKAKSHFLADSASLHGSGREDIDVRMLGRGRPFVMEFANPRKAYSCADGLA